MKRVLTVALSVLMAASLSACGSSSTSGTTTDTSATAGSSSETAAMAADQTFKINLSNPSSLDPSVYLEDDSGQIISWIQETLIRDSDTEAYAPGLAESFDISEDNLTYTVHLREGLVWENGDPITADDVVFSYQRLVDPNTASPNASIGYVFKNGEAINNGEMEVSELGVKAVDDQTVELTLEKVTPFFTEEMKSSKLAVVSKNFVEEVGDKYGTETGTTCASGPFRLDDWQQDYMVTLVKNENYWNAENIYIQKIEISMAADSTTEVSMYQTGQLSFLDVGSDYRPQFENEANYTITDVPGVSFIEFSNKFDYSNNENIRHALALAFNRDYYVQAMGNTTKPAEGLVPYGITGKDGKSYRETYGSMVEDVSQDDALIQQAKDLLAKGLEEMGKTQKDMEADFTINCIDSDGGKKGAQVIQQMWKDNLDLEVSITALQVNMLVPLLQDQTFYCVVGGGRSAEFDDPEDFVSFLYTEDKLADYPEFNKLIEEEMNATGDERLDLIAKAEQVALDTYLLVPQNFRTATYTYSDKLMNLHVDAFSPRFDLTGTYFAQ